MGGFIVGGIATIVVLAIAIGLGRALLRAPAADREATGDLVGALATVVSTIPDQGHGEVPIAQTDAIR